MDARSVTSPFTIFTLSNAARDAATSTDVDGLSSIGTLEMSCRNKQRVGIPCFDSCLITDLPTLPVVPITATLNDSEATAKNKMEKKTFQDDIIFIM